MPTDPHRQAVQSRELAIAIEALMREELVVNHYASRGYKVLSTDDGETRQILGISRGEPAADILVEAGPQRLIIAEVKGSDLDRALIQLQNTARYASSRYGSIACKIFVRNLAPRTDSVDLRGGRNGYRALRIFHSTFPGEWLLYEYLDTREPKLLQVGTDPVCIVFGPHV